MATMIKSKCGGCGSILSAPESYAGKNAKCPKCGTVVPVPQATIGGVSKAVLAAELEALAAKALSRAVSLVPPEERTSAEALTAAPIPAPSEEEEAKEPVSEARPRRFRVEILISVLGVAIVAGAVYFFAT
ncbi:MAG: hypothetical protein FJ278_21290, partial [Planctomycetes bacterium]|nr:hypothetical protein [Planctomycetota bacterium]